MAHYAKFIASDHWIDAAEYVADALNSIGIFDTVERSSNVITCKNDDTTVATITFAAAGVISVTFGNYTNNVNSGMDFWVGYTDNGVFFDGYIDRYELFTYAIYKNKKGAPMLTYRGAFGNAAGFVHVALDTVSPTLKANVGMIPSEYYSTMQAICAAPGLTDIVSVGSLAGLFVTRQNSVPTDTLSVISVEGITYLTDGYLCLVD